MNAFDRKSAEIEISYCVSSLRHIIASADRQEIVDKVYSALPLLQRESNDRLYEIRRFKRAENPKE